MIQLCFKKCTLSQILLCYALLLTVPYFQANVYAQASHKDLNVKDFQKVQIKGYFHLTLRKGSFNVIAEGKTSQLENLKAEVKNQQLTIEYKEKKILPSRVELIITLPQLQSLDIGGASKARVEKGLDYDNVAYYVSGASSAEIEVNTEHVYADVSGTSELLIKGSASLLKGHVAGTAMLKAFDFPVKKAELNVEGASGARVKVSEVLTANASGTSRVRYLGNPSQLITNAIGLSSIKKEE
jgi:hypothetical protein